MACRAHTGRTLEEPMVQHSPVEHALLVAVLQGVQQLLQDRAGLCFLQAGPYWLTADRQHIVRSPSHDC